MVRCSDQHFAFTEERTCIYSSYNISTQPVNRVHIIEILTVVGLCMLCLALLGIDDSYVFYLCLSSKVKSLGIYPGKCKDVHDTGVNIFYCVSLCDLCSSCRKVFFLSHRTKIK